MRVKDESAYDRILAAAAKLFAARGYEGTTTRQIVAEAGASLSSLQTYFQSKESLYREVLKKTQDNFYTINAPVLEEIDEVERQGLLDADAAWDLLVQLVGQTVEWAFMTEYANEILLINRELLQPSGIYEPLQEVSNRLYQYYQMLFERCVGEQDTYWAKALSFSVITSAFDYANYPKMLGEVLGCDMSLPENRQKAKIYAKQYMMTSIRANLNVYKQER